MVSHREFGPAATQYERLVVALAELQAKGRAALEEARAVRGRRAALYAEHKRHESEWRAHSAS
jgi:hypothetical protein